MIQANYFDLANIYDLDHEYLSQIQAYINSNGLGFDFCMNIRHVALPFRIFDHDTKCAGACLLEHCPNSTELLIVVYTHPKRTTFLLVMLKEPAPELEMAN
jgi:hypothetical protein